MLLFVPETYAPVILSRRARALRKRTGDSSYISEHDLHHRTFKEIGTIYLARPFKLLFTEPIVTLFSLYAAVLYGLLYMIFVAYVCFSFGHTELLETSENIALTE